MEIKESLIVDENDPLSKALKGVLDSGTAAIVTRKNRYYGIIDDRNLWLFSVQNPAKTKCKTVVVKPPVLSEDAGILERLNAFLLGHFKALPVIDERNRPIGITTRVELLKELIGEGLIPKIGVNKLMSSPVYLIDEKKKIGEAKLMMKRYNARRLVVTRKGKPVGTFSRLDLTLETFKPKEKQKMPAVISSKQGYDDKFVSDIYRPDIAIISSDSTLIDAAKVMIRKSVSAVVIVDEKSKPLGVLSALDIFKMIREKAKESLVVELSGLDEESILYREKIKEEILRVVKRFVKSYGIRRVFCHLKSKKCVYTVNIFVKSDKGNYTVKTEGPNVKDTIKMAVVELKKQLARKKHLEKSRKVLRKGGLL